MRYPIILWAALTFTFIMGALSDVVFGGSAARRMFWRRFLLAFIWPLALLTASGRDVLFNYTETSK